MAKSTAIIESSTIFEVSFDATAAKLQESQAHFCDLTDCKSIPLRVIRWFKIAGKAARRSVPAKDCTIKIAISCMRPEDHHSKRFICDAVVTEVESSLQAPITFDEATEKASRLSPIKVGTAVRLFLDTGSGRGCIIEYDIDAENEDGELETQTIQLPSPDDLIFDLTGLLPACMIETIDESTLFAKPAGTK